MRYISAITLIMLITIETAGAFEPFRTRGLPSGKIFAVTVIHGCPTEELVGEVMERGEELGADYTEVPEVVSASFCPSTPFGQMWAWHEVIDSAQGFGARFFGGIVVGLHYRITTE